MTATFAVRSATPAAWAEAVAGDVVALLSDHAHCELKAAGSALALLKRFPDRPQLALRLAPLIREESEHAHRVLRELDARGEPLRHDAPSPWAAGLRGEARRTSRRRDGLLDALLVSALIEMRSHERFAALAACATLAGLRPLYASLGAAEERHGELFVELAVDAFGAGAVGERFAELAALEAELIAAAPFDFRVHSGPPR